MYIYARQFGVSVDPYQLVLIVMNVSRGCCDPVTEAPDGQEDVSGGE